MPLTCQGGTHWDKRFEWLFWRIEIYRIMVWVWIWHGLLDSSVVFFHARRSRWEPHLGISARPRNVSRNHCFELVAFIYSTAAVTSRNKIVPYNYKFLPSCEFWFRLTVLNHCCWLFSFITTATITFTVERFAPLESTFTNYDTFVLNSINMN